MGYIEEPEALLDPKALGRLVGPSVHLMGNDPASGLWHGTVLIACHADVLPQEGARLTFSTAEQRATDVQGRTLYSQGYAGAVWSVVRYALAPVAPTSCCRAFVLSAILQAATSAVA